MLFDKLNSSVIKQKLMAKLQFSLGYKLINAYTTSLQPPKMDFETKQDDEKPMANLQLAKRKWVEFQDYCHTHTFRVDSLERVIAAYTNSTTKPTQKANLAMLTLRAKIAGKSIEGLTVQEEKQIEIAKAKLEEHIHQLTVEMSDIDTYFAGTSDSLDIEDIITNEFVILKYDDCVKTQTIYWEKYGWNDAELILIEADQKLLKQSRI